MNKISLNDMFKWLLLAYFSEFKSKQCFFKIAEDEQTKQQIYRLRYQIYVSELNRLVEGVDHKNQIIKDKYDNYPNTLLFYTEDNGNIIGTLRITIWPKEKIPSDVKSDFQLESYDWIKKYTVSEYGRLMFKREYRNKMLIAKFLLSISSYIVYHRDVRLCFLTCKPHLLTNYINFGFQVYTNALVHYPDGIEIPLIGIVDYNHLKSIHSPVQFMYHNIHSLTKNEIQDIFSQVSKSILFSKETDPYINLFLTQRLSYPYPPKRFFSLLAEYGCYILMIEKPINLIHKNMRDRTIYLIMDGCVEICLDNGTNVILEQGQLVGEFAYFLETGHRTTHVICNKGKLLTIKESALLKIQKKHRALYDEFLLFVIRSIILKFRALPR